MWLDRILWWLASKLEVWIDYREDKRWRKAPKGPITDNFELAMKEVFREQMDELRENDAHPITDWFKK